MQGKKLCAQFSPGRQGRRPPAAGRQGRHPPAAAGSIDEFGMHRLDIPNSPAATPPPPSPVSAKNRRFFGRGACKETIFSPENGIFKNRPAPTRCICTVRVGNADRSFSENSGKPEKSAAPIYGGWFRVLSGGSKWPSALPTPTPPACAHRPSAGRTVSWRVRRGARGAGWRRTGPARPRRSTDPAARRRGTKSTRPARVPGRRR